MRDRQISVRRVADELGISKTWLYEIISDHLGMNKVCTRWVPKLLAPRQRANWVDCCEELLKNLTKIQLNFSRIVMRNETWIYHYGSFSQQKAKTWKKSSEKTPTRSRVTRSFGKSIMTIFWDCGSILLVDFLPHGTTMNGRYEASLLHWLHFSIQEKCRGRLRRDLLLLHDNASFHKSNIIPTPIQYTDFTELNHRAYSPDVAPSHYHLFANMKNFLRGRNFESDNASEWLFRECWFSWRHRKLRWSTDSCDC